MIKEENLHDSIHSLCRCRGGLSCQSLRETFCINLPKREQKSFKLAQVSKSSNPLKSIFSFTFSSCTIFPLDSEIFLLRRLKINKILLASVSISHKPSRTARVEKEKSHLREQIREVSRLALRWLENYWRGN